ncbi:magnesium transporter CorA family protein [Priestia taiwanensis]|uniref:Transporter n=1 Tax=Priestia taiwanensis TaxID=1347902 RepID=A0A917APM0_9BACI|nr:magnesium transporter CorA family protein [Priestia taiwanensis]MBM7362896.1 magnesium transporter [Priestia taiwanensis]GGE66000.1 transporter [Priestia taiwanensis]
MLQFYLTDRDGKLQQVEEMTKNCWINMIAPTEEEIKKVSTQLQIPLDFIKDALDNDERSRIEKDDDKLLIIVDFPIVTYDEFKTPYYETMPIGVIITNDYFITVCLKDTPILHEFINGRVRSFFTFKKTRFALQILYVISSYYLRHLKQLNRQTDEIEKELHQSMKNKQLYALMSIEKSLVYFITSLKSNKIVMEKMMRQNILRMYEDDQDLLEDVIIENKQAIEMAEVHSTILSGMMDAYASIISNNMNIVMKFLTSFTIVLTFPTMVFSFYGMNVELPFQDIPFAWVMTVSLAFVLSSVTAIVFWKKKYF